TYAFAKSDIFNRQVGLIAAYNLEKAKNKTDPNVFDPKAFEVAESVVADVYGSSFPKAAAPIMGSDIAKTALTFKRFGIKRINLLQAAYKEATRDLDPNDPDSKIIRDAARREILGYFGTAFVSAGAQGMPLVGGAMLLVSVLNGVLGDDDEPYNPDFHMRETIGLFAYKGPINYLLGIDIASRTGWTGMFWREDPKRVAEVGPVTYAMEQLLGPAYSYAVGVPKAFDYMEEGKYQRAFEQLAPRFAANISKGFRYGTEGALTAKGVPLVDDVNAYNVFMQIIGFRPSDVAEAGDIAGATKQMESKIFQRRNAIIARAAVARMSGDVDGFQEAVAEAAEFSRKHPRLGITPETVFEAVQRRTKKLAMSVNGVTVNPKVARGIYEELGVTEEIE
nr:PLxRFG domain-containing protein [Sphingomonadales bacterium]